MTEPTKPTPRSPSMHDSELLTRTRILQRRLYRLCDAKKEVVAMACSQSPDAPVSPEIRGACARFALDASSIADEMSRYAIDPEPEYRWAPSVYFTLQALAMAFLYAAEAPDHAPLGFMSAAFSADQLATDMLVVADNAMDDAARHEAGASA